MCAGWRGLAERWWWPVRRAPPAKEAVASVVGAALFGIARRQACAGALIPRAITTASRAG
jgi:hypothetical protein